MDDEPVEPDDPAEVEVVAPPAPVLAGSPPLIVAPAVGTAPPETEVTLPVVTAPLDPVEDAAAAPTGVTKAATLLDGRPGMVTQLEEEAMG